MRGYRWAGYAVLGFVLVVLILWRVNSGADTVDVDERFDVSIASPAWVHEPPRVLIDEAHFNLHTASGRYKPLATLLANDGYDIRAGQEKFSADSLHDVDVLIIANARGGAEGTDDVKNPAFTDAECEAVRQWVSDGGALLLIADHRPFGPAAANLASRFDVEMGLDYVSDKSQRRDNSGTLFFTRENRLLGEHPILMGRSDSERVTTVATFVGQSVSVPSDAAPLLRLSETSYESPTPIATPANSRSAQGKAQAVALEVDRGRVVISGEAGMFSAQILKRRFGDSMRFGMNAPGNDDRQFALNILHWLSRAPGWPEDEVESDDQG
jgi:hypothetical protein